MYVYLWNKYLADYNGLIGNIAYYLQACSIVRQRLCYHVPMDRCITESNVESWVGVLVFGVPVEISRRPFQET
jgi:hypothetical protein